MRALWIMVLYGACLVYNPAAWGIVPEYTVTDLGTLPGASKTEALGINNCGQVVGWSLTSSGWRAFLWDRGNMTNLGLLPNSNYSQAQAINDNGVITGTSGEFTSSKQPFVWEEGEMTSLGFGGYGQDINQEGQIVGYTRGVSQAFLWDNGAVEYLETLGGPSAYAHGLNDHGMVVGDSETSSGARRACRWVEGTAYSLGEPTPPHIGSSSYAEDVNNNGQVVGWYTRSGYTYPHPYLWAEGTFTGLPKLPGNDMNFPKAINDLGHVVGLAYQLYQEDFRAILWEDGEVFNLNEYIGPGSEWILERAMDINNSGQIVGYGMVDGETRGFLLTPIPEPGPLEIVIDIKPGSDPNSVNLGAKGVVPVAIFGADEFDVHDVDQDSLMLEGASPKEKGKDDIHVAFEYINDDLFLDIIVQFSIPELELEDGAMEAALIGSLLDGTEFVGTDAIRLVGGPMSRGKEHAIPEPASVSLLLLGAVAMLQRRRRP